MSGADSNAVQETSPTGPPRLSGKEADALIKRAQAGDTSCLAQLRRSFRDDAYGREVVELLGSPPVWLEQRVVKEAAGKNLAMREASPIQLAKVRRELEGPAASPLERLLAERASLCWDMVHVYEMDFSPARDLTFRQGEYHQRKIDRAHGRFLSALRTLARVRKLALPAIQVNMAKNQGNAAGS
jgi:hypothetical protein